VSMIPFSQKPGSPKGEGYLDGQVLIAMPSMNDERFAGAVVYICAHSQEGAMGIVLNKPASNIRFRDLLNQLDLLPSEDAIILPENDIRILKGGPVETGRGFVLHTADVTIRNSSLAIDGQIYMTATLDILKAIAQGTGPSRAVLALGYTGWGPGQLETEIISNGWLHCAADQELIFHPATGEKYQRALNKIGIDPVRLSLAAGHA
jgi:putative transcriptional regulator